MNTDRTPKKRFDHATGSKMPKRKTEINMGKQVRKDILQKELVRRRGRGGGRERGRRRKGFEETKVNRVG